MNIFSLNNVRDLVKLSGIVLLVAQKLAAAELEAPASFRLCYLQHMDAGRVACSSRRRSIHYSCNHVRACRSATIPRRQTLKYNPFLEYSNSFKFY